mgnify:CR=1 FL=1
MSWFVGFAACPKFPLAATRQRNERYLYFSFHSFVRFLVVNYQATKDELNRFVREPLMYIGWDSIGSEIVLFCQLSCQRSLLEFYLWKRRRTVWGSPSSYLDWFFSLKNRLKLGDFKSHITRTSLNHQNKTIRNISTTSSVTRNIIRIRTSRNFITFGNRSLLLCAYCQGPSNRVPKNM